MAGMTILSRFRFRSRTPDTAPPPDPEQSPSAGPNAPAPGSHPEPAEPAEPEPEPAEPAEPAEPEPAAVGAIAALEQESPFPGQAAVLRGAILATQIFVALALLILLAGHYPLPPDPEPDPAAQEWQAMQAADEATLGSYGWLDQEQGIVHIPIRDAMKIMASQHQEGGSLGYNDVEEGQAIFQGEVSHRDFQACRTCHYTDPARGILVGPNLAGVDDRAPTRVPGLSAEEYLRQSIIRHDDFVVEGFEEGLMISIVGEDFGNILSDREIDSLVAYLMTLSESTIAETEAEPTPTPIPTPRIGEEISPDTSQPDTRLLAADDGFSFQPVEGWLASYVDGKVVIRPSDAGYNNGPIIAMNTGTLKDLNFPNVSTSKLTTTEKLFDALLERFALETHAVTLTSVATVSIGGHQGRLARLSGWGLGDIETDINGRFAIVMIDEDSDPAPGAGNRSAADGDEEAASPRLFVMMGLATPPTAWNVDAEFEQVLQSVQFGDSQASSGYDVPFPAPLPLPPDSRSEPTEPDREKGPRFACVHCHVTHNEEMLHESNPSCASCHSGTPYQRHCVDCHSIHDVSIPHVPHNPGCTTCHSHGIPGDGVDIQRALVTFLAYLFHEI